MRCLHCAGSGARAPSKREELCESGLPDPDVCGVDWESEPEELSDRTWSSSLAEAYHRG